ncbi:MAG TPA: cysteine synthase A [Polyangiaceae bacterium]|nr:cysteine synthase A [Polyangiaceae bacterium]
MAATNHTAKEPHATTVTASGLRVANDALGLVGQTPLVRLRPFETKKSARIWAKCEFLNPGGSIKDRPAWAMIAEAERSGQLQPGATLVEATSGNTGISLAMIAAVRGYRCVLVMPEDMSVERRNILRAYGAEVVLTSMQEGMRGAVEKAEEIVKRTTGAMMLQQFSNDANPNSHELATAREILEQTSQQISAFVAGVGTGGTVTGVGRGLKAALGTQVQVIAVEPESSAVLSGRAPGLHGIQGLGAGFVPQVFDRSVIDQVRTVTEPEAERAMRRLAREAGLLVGPSSGANVHVAIEVAREQGIGDVVTILCDSGERYLV